MPEIALRAEGLTKRFGSLIAVDHLTVEVEQGQIFGFLGPNGAGKTTSIRMMTGLLQPDEGTVTIHGHVVQGGGRDAVAGVGVCPQALVIWKKLTCLEQLEFLGRMYNLSRAEANRRARQLLDRLGLSAKAKVLAKDLSGGMQRRLNLAASLIHDPRVVVLDEPEAGLDPQSRVLVRDFIKSLARHKTIVLTTHNMDEADRLVDTVAIIDHGKLLVHDTPERLKRSLGDGDRIEIGIRGENGISLDSAIAGAVLSGLGAQAFDNTVVIRSQSVGDHLPAAIDELKRFGLTIGEVHVRPISLEDVFLARTGRGLRE